MFYKPEYCCSCGEKIERTEWKPWTSRRFCETCQQDHKVEEWTPKAVGLICVLTGIFGFGNFLSKPEKPLNLSSRQFAENSVEAKKSAKDIVNQNAGETSNQSNTNAKTVKDNRNQAAAMPVQTPLPVQTNVENQIVSATEPTYFCGAATKKGTPCSRKVKGSGRCWQHKGQAAILPPEKLIAVK